MNDSEMINAKRYPFKRNSMTGSRRNNGQPAKRSRPLQFSLRSIFVTVLVVAVLLALARIYPMKIVIGYTLFGLVVGTFCLGIGASGL